MSMSKTYTFIYRYCKCVTPTYLHIGNAHLPAIRTRRHANTQAHSGVAIPNRRDENDLPLMAAEARLHHLLPAGLRRRRVCIRGKMIYRSWPRGPALSPAPPLHHAADIPPSILQLRSEIIATTAHPNHHLTSKTMRTMMFS